MMLASALFAADQTPPWIRKTSLPEPGAFALAAGIGGKIYVLTSGEERHDGADVFEYDPGTDSWRKRSGAPSRRCGFGGAVLDGKIYVWGGVNRGSAPGRDTINDTVEVYDPATDSWSVRQARMPAPRLFATGAAANGKLYAVGGILLEDGKETSAVHEYDPRADRWSERKPMLFERRVYRVVGAGGKLYTIGGYSDSYPDLLVEEYDPATDEWTRRPNQLSRNYDHAVAVAGDEIWVIGGASPAVQVYAPRSGQWSKRPDLPDPLPGPVAAVVNGRIFAVSALSGTLYEFNPEGKEPAAVRKIPGWQKKADMPTPRRDHFAVAVGNKVYILGGSVQKGDKTEPTNAVDVYHTATDRWTAAKPSPESINKAAAVDGRIYSFGEKGSYSYDPSADVWTEIAPVPTRRRSFAIAVLNGKIFVIGGMTPDPAHRWGFQGDGDAVEAYNPKTNEWAQKAKLPQPGHAFTAVTLGSKIYLVGGHRLEVYDPAADSWTTLAPVPDFSAYCGAFELNGRILVLPGMLASVWAMQEHDPATNSWRVSRVPAHTRRRVYASASVNGKIYTFGGVDGIEWDDWNRPLVGLTEEFNP